MNLKNIFNELKPLSGKGFKGIWGFDAIKALACVR
jgi:hypothetical protein